MTSTRQDRKHLDRQPTVHINLVCDRAGLASDKYSFAYVAGWSGGDPDSVRATAERVLACARRIVEQFHLHLDHDDEGAASELVGSDSAA